MTLDQYLAEQAITEAAFAARVEVDQSTVHRLRAKGQTPNKALMARIFEATSGRVRADDFFGLPTPTEAQEAA